MKLSKIILTVFICSFISFTTQINVGKCSENLPVLPPDEPVSQSAQQPAAQTTQQQPVTTTQPVQQTSQEATEVQNSQVTEPKSGFLPALINMLVSLAKVVLLIISIAGIILLYKRIKSQMPAVERPKKQQEQDEDESREPATVSEAVSSFVRHKIKKT